MGYDQQISHFMPLYKSLQVDLSETARVSDSFFRITARQVRQESSKKYQDVQKKYQEIQKKYQKETLKITKNLKFYTPLLKF